MAEITSPLPHEQFVLRSQSATEKEARLLQQKPAKVAKSVSSRARKNIDQQSVAFLGVRQSEGMGETEQKLLEALKKRY